MDKNNSKTSDKAVQTCSNWSSIEKKVLAEKGKQLLKEFILKINNSNNQTITSIKNINFIKK